MEGSHDGPDCGSGHGNPVDPPLRAQAGFLRVGLGSGAGVFCRPLGGPGPRGAIVEPGKPNSSGRIQQGARPQVRPPGGINLAIRVLFVDDSSFMRGILKGIILKEPFILAGEAENGREAVEQYQALKPDLVTMDIVMPEMDGIEAVKAIREINPDARII